MFKINQRHLMSTQAHGGKNKSQQRNPRNILLQLSQAILVWKHLSEVMKK